MKLDAQKKWPMLIGGKLVESESGMWLESVNPANEQPIGLVPAGTRADVELAYQAAAAAQPAWGALTPAARGGYLLKVAAAMRARAEEILQVEVIDTGNTITKMKADVEQAAVSIEFFAGLGTELKGETIPASADNLHISIREPYGVVGRIVPFNHPIKFASNAMAGNTVIVKPPEQSPLSASILAEICAGLLPPGVVNIVTGNGMPVGDAIVRHPGIKRLALTGSVPTGMAVQRAAAEVGVKHISLELGGKNPMIVFPDMDPEKISDVAIGAMNFAWSGQSCGSASRLLVHESLYDAVLEKLVAKVKALRLGEPLDGASQMGPLNSKTHYERVCAMIQKGKDEKARLMTGGGRPAGKPFEKGYWVEPTAEVTPQMTIGREEIFGPVLSVFKWKDEAQALEIANSTAYGLTASIWTNDLKTALRVAKAVRSGYVWVNNASAHYTGTGFGGMKNSGIGREEGLDELLSYTELKTIHIKL